MEIDLKRMEITRKKFGCSSMKYDEKLIESKTKMHEIIVSE